MEEAFHSVFPRMAQVSPASAPAD